MKQEIILKITAISGVLAVILGAFGAHGLSGKLTESQMHTFETGSEYHFYHTLALLGLAVLMGQKNEENKALKWATWAFMVGIVLFSGSLYLLACKNLLGLGKMTAILGPVTPLGGVCFIIGWIMLVLYKRLSP